MNRNQKDGASFHIQLCPLLLSVSCYLLLLSIGAISLSGPPTVVICLQPPHHNKNNTILFMAEALVAATIRATGVHAAIVNVETSKINIGNVTSFPELALEFCV